MAQRQVHEGRWARQRENGYMRTARERVREWERWHDRAKGCYETA